MLPMILKPLLPAASNYHLVTMDERSIFFEVWVRDFALAQENGDAGIPGNCPLDRVLRLLWHEWTTHILWVLGSNGPTRFGELQRRIRGISPKVLSQRLASELRNKAGLLRKRVVLADPDISDHRNQPP